VAASVVAADVLSQSTVLLDGLAIVFNAMSTKGSNFGSAPTIINVACTMCTKVQIT
jgi:hypothetical protein